MRRRPIWRLLRLRRPLVVVIHLLLVILANYLAFWLRFDGDIPHEYRILMRNWWPALLTIRGVVFVVFRLFEGMWRYTSIWDLRNIVSGIAVSSLVFAGTVMLVANVAAYPRSVYLIDAMLLVLLLSAPRLSRRIYGEVRRMRPEGRRVLIYGAGDAGEMIVREMRHEPSYGYRPIGFIDDDPTKVGQRIHGVKILGTGGSLAAVIRASEPDVVLVAMPSTDAARIRAIARELEPFKVQIQIVPDLRDLIDGEVAGSRIRTPSLLDLLDRSPVDLNKASVRNLIEGRRVLVTGAGGSIGSELAAQIISLNPECLVLLDRYENGVFAVNNSLNPKSPLTGVEVIIGDITDQGRMERIFEQIHPEVVFHAAAHKHVALMECNPCEAVKNNVRGTRLLLELARRFEVQRFVLISSDKAVNPTSVMGSTKRIAELLAQSMNGGGPGAFTAVRFGNVLASNGSVIPLFIEQIRNGGPVTVTHPEVRRYFMLVSEAVHLVLTAATLSQGGEVFVLDMGEQIRVLDLARNLIRLLGYVPETEIPIKFIGLRPGEKEYEELSGDDEALEPAGRDKILRVRLAALPDREWLAAEVDLLEQLALEGDSKRVLEHLSRIVPTYRPFNASMENGR
jgi:FlaA1/EpsC-like NDP-sugar epimerase